MARRRYRSRRYRRRRSRVIVVRGGGGRKRRRTRRGTSKKFGGGKKLFGFGTNGLIAGLGAIGVGIGVLFGSEIGKHIPYVNKTGFSGPVGAAVVGGPAAGVAKFALDKFAPGLVPGLLKGVGSGGSGTTVMNTL